MKFWIYNFEEMKDEQICAVIFRIMFKLSVIDYSNLDKNINILQDRMFERYS